MSTLHKPLLLSGDVEEERRAEEGLAALVSSLKDAAGEVWVGAALGGLLGSGEGVPSDPFDLLVVLDVPLRGAAAMEKELRRAMAETARGRRLVASVRVVAAGAVPLLPPTLQNADLLGSGRVVDGPAFLLGAAPRFLSDAIPLEEGLSLLVRRGASMLEAEGRLDRTSDLASARQATTAIHEIDLALGAALLLAAGRWVPAEEARQRGLAALASAETMVNGSRPGFQAQMSWTRFRDLVQRHRVALEARRRTEGDEAGDARRQLARAADRWMEVLRLYEETRLGVPLPSWTAYACALEERHRRGTDGLLFEGAHDEPTSGLPTRRSARSWPPAERLAPAVAALADWDPGDLPIVPILLDLPNGASRDALRQRAIGWGREI